MTDDRNVPERTGPDIVTLIMGLITLAVASSVLMGGFGHLQWMLTATAVAFGAILLLISSSWRRRR